MPADRSPRPRAVRWNNAFVTARVLASGLDPWRLGGEMWGWYRDGRLEALCYNGANLVPLCAGPQ
ncbi:DUF4081 domain-containing protein, partial [Streptomyces sp. PU-14G]|uniref:DUF4081 domain-containing protein n=1 Tax=Streptomyces sp. PU-14G TaxID=2800808 RepID=UPI0034DFF463